MTAARPNVLRNRSGQMVIPTAMAKVKTRMMMRFLNVMA